MLVRKKMKKWARARQKYPRGCICGTWSLRCKDCVTSICVYFSVQFLGGVYMWKLAPVLVWYRYDIVISYRVYMKGYFMSTDAIVAPYWIEYRRLRLRYPFQTPGRVISCWSERPYRVHMTSEWVFVPEWKFRSGTVTGVNSHRYDSLRYKILCCYHVNEYRATRGNLSELVPEWKSRRYHVNTPLAHSLLASFH